MRLEIKHLFLVPEADWQSASQRVLDYLNRSLLVRYASVIPCDTTSKPATKEQFWPLLEQGLTKNMEVLATLVDELADEGYKDLNDLKTMDQGFQSKILHTITHLLDGFLGIDSFFYNLVEDSHQVSTSLRATMAEHPEDYWLVSITGSSEIPGDDPLGHLRTFEAPETEEI